MSRFRYTDSEREVNSVLANQDDQLSRIDFSEVKEQSEKRISASEELLESMGYELPKRGEAAAMAARREIVLPTWEECVAEAVDAGKRSAVLDDLFTPDELLENSRAVRMLNDQYDQAHRLDRYDIAISASAALLAAAVDILLVGVPRATGAGAKAGTLENYIRAAFDRKFPREEMERLANSSVSKVPYDAQDNRNTEVWVEGLSAYYHRLLSLGHDPLLGFLFGVSDILNGRMTTIDKAGRVVSQVMECYTGRRETDVFVALAKQVAHLKSDLTTSMGLPAPMMSLFNLMQFGSIGEFDHTVAETVQEMYYRGYDFIHFCSLSIPAAIIEVVVRLGYAIRRIRAGASIREALPLTTSRQSNPKLGTMLFIAHSGATAINAGRVAFTRDPMDINYPQWLLFAKYSYQQAKWVLFEKPQSRSRFVQGVLDGELDGVCADVQKLFYECSPENIEL